MSPLPRPGSTWGLFTGSGLLTGSCVAITQIRRTTVWVCEFVSVSGFHMYLGHLWIPPHSGSLLGDGRFFEETAWELRRSGRA